MSKRLVLYVDGACHGNPGPAALGVVIRDEKENVIKTISEAIGPATNNVAEYFGLIFGLQEAVALGATEVLVNTDSQLMARQFTGQYKVKEPNMRLLHRIVKQLAGYFEKCEVEHIPRELNKEADKLAGEAIA